MKAKLYFKKESFWSVQCSTCREFFVTGDNLYDLFKTKQEAKETIREMGWEVKGEKVYCENCK